jgi:hypothetical protein
MNETEQNLRERSKRLMEAGTVESDPALQFALLAQSERLGMQAIALELERKQNLLKSWGIPLHA